MGIVDKMIGDLMAEGCADQNVRVGSKEVTLYLEVLGGEDGHCEIDVQLCTDADGDRTVGVIYVTAFTDSCAIPTIEYTLRLSHTTTEHNNLQEVIQYILGYIDKLSGEVLFIPALNTEMHLHYLADKNNFDEVIKDARNEMVCAKSLGELYIKEVEDYVESLSSYKFIGGE